MRRIHALAAAAAATLALSACGGGGGGSSSPSVPVHPTNPEFNRLVTESQAFYRSHARGGMDANRTAEMPRAGNFTYQGTALMWTGDKIDSTLDKPNLKTLAAVGKVEMQADIAAGEVKGTVSGFQAAPGRPAISGNLGLDGTISGTDYIGSTSGRLSVGDKNHEASGRMMGHFVGKQAQGTAGLVSGNLDDGADTFFMTYTGKQP